ncbi:hypothetical protein BC749_108143 [Flavobacterium araucananum]|uniref:Uncharacterized protein n=1 Tax=Flavobacterium araucananum TaxID=946678 RepID=A0A227NS56_9FLAO|nr:hypothetical protein [Flavobacterium araucananum]OXG00024.1 hypothetical protein B0A64_20915 [Flavobacterium araucananum]PWJ96993.1 hypothetical protein BC749_108143 [Flavobacterium araucananum]
MSRKYHLSYDAIDVETDFKNYDEAKRYILCVLGNTGYSSINSYCESTFIIEYDDIQSKLFDYLQINLTEYFYYSVSLVAVTTSGSEFIDHNINPLLNLKFKLALKKLSYDNLGKEITPY